MTNRSILSVLLGIACLTTAPLSLAAARVAIVVPPSVGPEVLQLETRLRSELVAVGFEVISVQIPQAPNPANLEEAAEQSGSVAAISIAQPSGSVTADVWVAERVTGKTLFRSVRSEPLTRESPTILALRAVELLRASLLELNENHPPRGQVPAPVAVRAWVAPAPAQPPAAPVPIEHHRAWGIAVGATLLGGPGGIPLAIAPAIGVAWRPSAHWASEIRWEGPFKATLDTPVASVAVDQEMATYRVRWLPIVGRRLNPWVSLGVGGYRVGVHGAATVPYHGRSDGAYTLAGLVGGGVSVDAGRGVCVVGGLDAWVVASRPAVRVADQLVAHSGRPSVSGALLLEYTW